MAQERTGPLCGARTRSGGECRAYAMDNGRCRMHGGKSPGAASGNTNAVTHGGYASVLRDALDDDTRKVFDGAAVDADAALDDTLRALTVREYRVLKHLVGAVAFDAAAEKALTAIQNAKLRALAEKLKLRDGGDGTDGLDAFLGAFDGLRADVAKS